jgi:hypothetical protein
VAALLDELRQRLPRVVVVIDGMLAPRTLESGMDSALFVAREWGCAGSKSVAEGCV